MSSKSIAFLFSLFTAVYPAGFTPPTGAQSCKPLAFTTGGDWTGIVTTSAIVNVFTSFELSYVWSFDLNDETFSRILPYPAGTLVSMSNAASDSGADFTVEDSGDSSCVMGPTLASISSPTFPTIFGYSLISEAPCQVSTMIISNPGDTGDILKFSGTHAGNPVANLSIEISLFDGEWSVQWKLPFPANSTIQSTVVDLIGNIRAVGNFVVPPVAPGSKCVLGS